MDETSLRAHLELAVSAEPPLGPLVGNSLRAGRRLRRRRAIGAASVAAVAVLLVGAVSALAANADHGASRPHPAASGQAPETGTAYVATGSTVVPIDLATNTPGKPVPVPGGIPGPFVDNVATSPNGQTIYETGEPDGRTTVTPIDTRTNTAGPTITVKHAFNVEGFALMPDGKAAYLSGEDGVFRVSMATNSTSQLINCRMCNFGAMALTPNGKTLYVISSTRRVSGVTVIRTASDTALTRITSPASDTGGPFKIAITPNGKTVYVLYSSAGAKPGTSSVVPISVATNTPLTPIKIWAPGFADNLIIAPDGRTAYALSTRGVTSINTATNQVEATISLPESVGYAYYMVLAANGKTLYVLTPRGIVPISTASGTVLPTIKVPHLYTFTVMAITPDSRTIYVGAEFLHKKPGHPFPSVVAAGVVPISTATGTAGRYINLGGQPYSITFGP